MSVKMHQVPVNYPGLSCTGAAEHPGHHLHQQQHSQPGIPANMVSTNGVNSANMSCRYQNIPPPLYTMECRFGSEFDAIGMPAENICSPAREENNFSAVSKPSEFPGLGPDNVHNKGMNHSENQQQQQQQQQFQYFDVSPTFQTSHPVSELWSPTSPFSLSSFGSSSAMSDDYSAANNAGGSSSSNNVAATRFDVHGRREESDVRSHLRSVLQARMSTPTPAATATASSPYDYFAVPAGPSSSVPATPFRVPALDRETEPDLNMFGSRPGRKCVNPPGEDAARRQKRRERNKVAATKCRNKKKERQLNLVKEAEVLETQHRNLKAEQFRLLTERETLERTLDEHKKFGRCCNQVQNVHFPVPCAVGNDPGRHTSTRNPDNDEPNAVSAEPTENPTTTATDTYLDLDRSRGDNSGVDTSSSVTLGCPNDGLPSCQYMPKMHNLGWNSFDASSFCSGSTPTEAADVGLGFPTATYFPNDEKSCVAVGFDPNDGPAKTPVPTVLVDLDNQQNNRQGGTANDEGDTTSRTQLLDDFDSPSFHFDADSLLLRSEDFSSDLNLMNDIQRSLWEII